jgi:hypothetical protein
VTDFDFSGNGETIEALRARIEEIPGHSPTHAAVRARALARLESLASRHGALAVTCISVTAETRFSLFDAARVAADCETVR